MDKFIFNVTEETAVCLAVASGTVSTEGGNTRYYGVAPCFVREVNPSKQRLGELFGREWTKDVNYLKQNDKGQAQVRLCFPIITDPSKTNGVELTILHNITLTNAPAESADGTKVQVVDEFGDFAWIEKSQLGQRPMNSNGPAKCTANYRQAYQGEEQLTRFLIARVNIPSPWNYINKEWVLPEGDHSHCMARLDHIADYFKGDVSEIQGALNCNPNNYIKVLIGLRPYDGNLYQDIFYHRGEGYMKLAQTNYGRLDTAVSNYLENHPDHIYKVCDFEEYKPSATDLGTAPSTSAPQAVNPFATNAWGSNPNY